MIIKNDNIPFLEGYFISKKGRLWSRYDKSGHITKDPLPQFILKVYYYIK